MSILIVTGTGTGVGKTVVTAALAALARAGGSRVAVVKPVQTGVPAETKGGAGDEADLVVVRRLAEVTDLHELARFPDPLSPEAAARAAGLPPLDLRDAAGYIGELSRTRDLVLVEGAGGLLVRYDCAGTTLADLAKLLDAGVLVVTEPGLGTLNHTALTLEALASRGLVLAGVVIGRWPSDPGAAEQSNLTDLEAIIGGSIAGVLPDGCGGAAALEFLVAARAGLTPKFGGEFDPAVFTEARRSHLHRPEGPDVEGTGVTDTDSHEASVTDDILEVARQQVLAEGRGLDEAQVLACLRLPDERLGTLLALAHDVRMRWCGPDVEVEGIVSVKTGGCPEDCHFCSQSGRYGTPVRTISLNISELVEAARTTAATGATEFCIVAAVRGPDERLMAQVRNAVEAITEAVEINIACSLGILTPSQADDLARLGVHRYNHNLETARSFFGQVVTTHTWEERHSTCSLVRSAGMELCCGGIIGMGESLEQRAELAAQLAELGPHEVPLNFLNPRPGTPLADRSTVSGPDALRTIAAFRLALPRTVLRYAGGRELTLGDLGTEAGMLGGINAIIVGNYLTTLGRAAQDDIDMLARLRMPVKALSQTL